MEKNIFILLICSLFVISYSQIPEKNSNLKSLRRLEQTDETILIGFDNYQLDINPNSEINTKFNAYFLLKNWNESIIDDDDLNLSRMKIISTVTNQSSDVKNYTFNCDYDPISKKSVPSDDKTYKLITFICQGNLASYPKKISIATDFEKEIQLNNTIEIYESSSAKAIKKDITSLSKFDSKFGVLSNASFVNKEKNSFKIRGDLDFIKNFDDASSNNIELITLVNGYPKKIPCSGKYAPEDPDDDNSKGFFFIETNEQNTLTNAELKYALFNYTKGSNRMGILDFKEGENSTFIENTYLPKKKKGLSTGAIIGIIIPSCIVLLGVSALVFLLSRKPLPAQQIKNIGNNTIGVASSEAVVHQ